MKKYRLQFTDEDQMPISDTINSLSLDNTQSDSQLEQNAYYEEAPYDQTDSRIRITSFSGRKSETIVHLVSKWATRCGS
jgi:hypothetical protein